eukprot:2985542-Amphidinium_carterae.1
MRKNTDTVSDVMNELFISSVYARLVKKQRREHRQGSGGGGGVPQDGDDPFASGYPRVRGDRLTPKEPKGEEIISKFEQRTLPKLEVKNHHSMNTIAVKLAWDRWLSLVANTTRLWSQKINMQPGKNCIIEDGKPSRYFRNYAEATKPLAADRDRKMLRWTEWGNGVNKHMRQHVQPETLARLAAEYAGGEDW